MHDSNPTFDVLTVGEAMALLVAQTPGALAEVEHFSRTSAGAELNVATGLARLGWRVGYVSRVGQDPFGDFLLSTLDREGIDRSLVQRDARHPTGLMLKSCEPDGRDPQIAYYRQGSAASHLSQEDLPTHAWIGTRWLHITGISVALSDCARALVQAMVQRARAAGVAVSFDPNLRPRLWPSQAEMVAGINSFAMQSDLVMPGLAEGQLLTGQLAPCDVASWYLDHGVRQVIVKLGGQGAYVADASARATVPGFLVPRVVDTVGAGDGFAVGVLSALLDGLSPVDAALRGNAIGARVVQYVGDSEGLPNADQLRQSLLAPRAVPSP
jgi:sugar/nucleoside kinase (ribokinase family)